MSTRGAFSNLRTVGYVASIGRAKASWNTDTPFMLTVISQLRFLLEGHVDHSRVWVRIYAFTTNFTPKVACGQQDFGIKVGDCIEGLISPSYGEYGTSVFEAWDIIEPKEFDRVTERAHRCLDPWSDTP